MNDTHGRIILVLSWTIATCFIAFEGGRIYAKTEAKKQYNFKSVKPAFGTLLERQ
jgi:hypothetical protein